MPIAKIIINNLTKLLSYIKFYRFLEEIYII